MLAEQFQKINDLLLQDGIPVDWSWEPDVAGMAHTLCVLGAESNPWGFVHVLIDTNHHLGKALHDAIEAAVVEEGVTLEDLDRV